VTKDLRRELKVTEDDVREEHLREVNATAQWLYLGSVLAGGFLLMIGLIALLGSTGG
jgi:hypothetical protein